MSEFINYILGLGEVYSLLFYMILWMFCIYAVYKSKEYFYKYLLLYMFLLQITPILAICVHRLYMPIRIWSGLQIVILTQIIYTIYLLRNKEPYFKYPVLSLLGVYLFLFIKCFYLFKSVRESETATKGLAKILTKYQDEYIATNRPYDVAPSRQYIKNSKYHWALGYKLCDTKHRHKVLVSVNVLIGYHKNCRYPHDFEIYANSKKGYYEIMHYIDSTQQYKKEASIGMYDIYIKKHF